MGRQLWDGGRAAERFRERMDIREASHRRRRSGRARLNETSPTPWGSSPAYYDTCRMVNVTGTSNAAQVVARGVDGLEVWELNAQGVWQQLATLSALSDANGWNQEKYWASIQYANLDGSASGQQEVVARGPNGVVVYKYDTAAESVGSAAVHQRSSPDRRSVGQRPVVLLRRCAWGMLRATVARTR